MNGQRRTVLLVLAGVVVVAAALAVGLVLLSSGGGSSSPTTTVQVRTSLFAGIRQQGASLGDPLAPPLSEYADLQCPYCGEFAREVLPTVVRSYVRTGKVRLVFRGLAFIGPDSTKALRAVYAAGLQNHLWDVVEALYAAQGAENSGWVTDGLLRGIGAQVAGLDVSRWLADVDSPKVTAAIAAASDAALAHGVRSTPTFVLRDTRLDVQALTPSAFSAALDPHLPG